MVWKLNSILITLFIGMVCSCTANASRYYGSKICKSDEYVCYTTKRHDSWEKLFPDEEKRSIVRRINRMNTRLPGGIVIAIPKGDDWKLMDYSPFPQQGDATGSKHIEVSLSKQAFAAYDENGSLQHWGPVSTARGYCADLHHGCHTPVGSFAIYGKGGAGCVSNKFPVGRGGAPMPYCMYFHGGFALHGSYEVVGYNASHGCVRMFVDDAKWLNREFTAGVSHVAVDIVP